MSQYTINIHIFQVELTKGDYCDKLSDYPIKRRAKAAFRAQIMKQKYVKICKIALIPATLLFCQAFAFAGGLEISTGETLFKPPFNNGAFVELLIRHTSGKAAGYDKKTGQLLSELPGSCYAEQGLGASPKVKNLVCPNL